MAQSLREWRCTNRRKMYTLQRHKYSSGWDEAPWNVLCGHRDNCWQRGPLWYHTHRPHWPYYCRITKPTGYLGYCTSINHLKMLFSIIIRIRHTGYSRPTRAWWLIISLTTKHINTVQVWMKHHRMMLTTSRIIFDWGITFGTIGTERSIAREPGPLIAIPRFSCAAI